MRRTNMIGLGTMLATAMTVVIAAPAAAQTANASEVKLGVDAWASGDYAAAVARWRPSALAGDPDAQFNLGQAYKLGRGVPLDGAAAQEWFLKAAKQGHQQAEDNYGLALYTAGRKSDAVSWLEKSVARGEARSELVLGTMLFNGDGIARDVPRAYSLMTLASQKGLKSASETLSQMDQYISAGDREKGVRLLAGSPAIAPTPKPTPTPVRVAAAKPPVTPTPAKIAKATPKPTPQGAWRIQLGAFRDRANAETMWKEVRVKLGSAQPTYVKAGAVTRLQAAGYAGKADAQRACSAAGTSCVVVAP
ncbi:MAG TPA: SPOR domain-containing protein [Sphingomonas sp.]